MAISDKVFPNFTKNSLVVLKRRYQAKDEKGNTTEEPDGIFRRVAHNLAQAEWNYASPVEKPGDHEAYKKHVKTVEEDFYRMMRSFDCLPCSPTLMNAGRKLQMLSACFVLPIEDDMDSIFSGVHKTAMVHKSGGGTGFSFSRLRPKGDIVGSTGGTASGPVSFLRVYDAATEEVKQGGTRRGANMAILRIDHPDILEFIKCKEDGKSISNFNISVGVTEKWIELAKRREDYNLINPKDGSISGVLNAGEVFDLITEMAWKTGDPGLWFVDRVNRTNVNPHLGEIESCNPCGEQELLPWESCNLASVNLGNHLSVDDGETFNWEKLRNTVHLTVHLLDNVIDMNEYPIPEIAEMTRKTRRIGLGIMGWADSLIKLGMKYDSEAALELARKVMQFIQAEAHLATRALAERRGCYPAWEGSRCEKLGIKIRNTSPVTIAPTGTISIIAGASSGVEPLFALSYVRSVMDRDQLIEVYEPLRREAEIHGFNSTQLWEELAERGSLSELSPHLQRSIPSFIFDTYRTSYDVSPEWHVRMQAAFQEFTDNSVSKTVNLPESATKETIAQAYLLAYELNCKGITVYRDGSKVDQVLSFGKNSASEHTSEMKALMASLPVRPKEIEGKIIKMSTGHGNLYVTIGHIDGKMVETFTNIGKAGGCESAQMEAITRLISVSLRAGVEPERIIEQLKGITCCPTWADGVQIRSAPDAIALAMEGFLGIRTPDVPIRGGQGCPDCFSQVVYQEGCIQCTNAQCGWSKCD